MLVITGGNGRLGRMIGGFLRDKIGTDFAVTTRDPAKAADLAAAGISVRGGDYSDAAATLTGTPPEDAMTFLRRDVTALLK
jgi:NAD(P)H dehydrogenase (quinone)